ncbi:MAG: hypothetical protein WC389_12405 [Lutibacter sp.]
MTNRTQNILIFMILFMANISICQNNYNDLYFAKLKGNVKICSTTTESFDSTSFYFGHLKKVVSSYNPNGNCYYETEWIDTSIIQKREIIFDNVNGIEKRIRKITTHSADTINKKISYYHFDELGFDTSIVVCSLDSSYFMLYKHEKNNFGLRTKGTEINPKNGHVNYSFEIYYSMDKVIDSITYKNGTVNYTEYYIYKDKNDVAQIYYSDGGCTQFEYYKCTSSN